MESSSSRTLNRGMIVAVVAIIALALVSGVSAVSYIQANNKVTSYSQEVATQSSAIASLNGQLSSLNGQVSSQSSQIQNLNGKVSSDRSQIQSLSGQVSTESAQIGSLNLQISLQSEQITSQTSEISSLQSVTASLSADVANPTVTILKGQATLQPTYFLYQTVPDSFECHDNFTASSPVTVYYFTAYQFAEWVNGSSVTGGYPSPVGPTTSSSDNFALSEGCGAYVAVYVPQNRNVVVTFSADITATYTPSPVPTGACAG